MFNFFKSIKFGHSVAAGGSVYVTYLSLWDSIKNNKIREQLKSEIVKSDEKIKDLMRQIDALEKEKESLSRTNAEQNELINQNREYLIDLQNKFLEFQKKLDGYMSKVEKHESVDTNELVSETNAYINNVNEYNSIYEKALDLINQNKPFGNKFINGDSISSFLENLKIFISDLSFEELWAVAHICSSIFIFLLLFNIISIIYSDFLLNYLKIEEKFPKLGKIIKYRRIYQQYYLIINILFIIITLMATIFINYHILINLINT